MTATPLSMREAQALLDHVLEAADGPITVAICDAAGDLVLLHRDDGAAGFTADIASGKAYTAARFANSTSVLEQLWSERPVYAHSLVAQGKWFVGRGGVPVLADGLVRGAIGVSGSDPHVEEQIAEAAVAAIS